MKYNQVFILALLITFSYAEDSCSGTTNPSKKKDCNGVLSEAEKRSNYKYCCYLEADSLKKCVPYKQEDYDAIGKADKKDLKGGKIECFSPFIKLSLLGLLFFAL